MKLASLLPQFNSISHLKLSFVDAEVDALITSITHKSLKELTLSGIILTPTAAAALGRSLPEMTSLETLVLDAAWNQGSLQTVDTEALFCRFNKLLPLHYLRLENLNTDEQNFVRLLKRLRFLPNFEELSVDGNRLAPADSRAAEANT